MRDLQELRRRVEGDLADLLPGGRLIDADVAIEANVPIDFVLADSEGRLVLCLLVRGGAEESVFTALDAVSFARRHERSLVRGLFQGEVDPALRPRVVLLAEHFAERALHRLQPLVQSVRGDLALYELRIARSRRGERVYFVPVAEERRLVAEAQAGGDGALDAFVASLPESRRELGRELVDRLSRVDSELEATLADGRLSWTLNGRLACELGFEEGASDSSTEVGGHALGRAGSGRGRGRFELLVPGADRVEVAGDEGLATALDRVLGRSLALLDSVLSGGVLAERVPSAKSPSAEEAAPTAVRRASAVESPDRLEEPDELEDLDELEEAEEAVSEVDGELDGELDGDELEDLDESEDTLGRILRAGSQELLTAEEIEAFRDF